MQTANVVSESRLRCDWRTAATRAADYPSISRMNRLWPATKCGIEPPIEQTRRSAAKLLRRQGALDLRTYVFYVSAHALSQSLDLGRIELYWLTEL